MKTLVYIALTTVAALSFAACGSMPANNANAGNASNANANKAAAAPTKEALLELEKKAFEAWSKKDGKYFEAFIADNFVGYHDGKVSTKAEEIKGIVESKCDVKSFDLSDPQVTPIGPDAAVLTTKATADATCDGKKLPSPVVSATLFVRSGDSWKAAYHNEVPVADIKAKVDAANAKVDEAKANKAVANANSSSTASSNTNSAKPASTATPSSNTTATSNTNTTSNTNNTASSTDVTAALVAVEKSGWDAWKARDEQKLKVLVTDNVTFVDINGSIASGKDAVMKAWVGPKCDIKTVNVSDPKGFSMSPTVAVLTFKGAATGQCEGNQLGALWGTGIYYKDGEAWKLAYGFENPAK